MKNVSLFTILLQYFDDNYRQIKVLSRLLTFLLALGYLGYHSLSGENGYRFYLQIKREIESKQKVLDKLTDDFKDLKLNVEYLNSKSLDLDLLEERCRVMLNYSYGDEIVIRTSTMSDLKR